MRAECQGSDSLHSQRTFFSLSQACAALHPTDRAHRIGQASSVNIHFLHAKGSVDDIIWSTIQNKLESVGEALDGQGQALEVAATARTIPEKGKCDPGKLPFGVASVRHVDCVRWGQ